MVKLLEAIEECIEDGFEITFRPHPIKSNMEISCRKFLEGKSFTDTGIVNFHVVVIKELIVDEILWMKLRVDRAIQSEKIPNIDK
jgi:hypothetical protein